MGSLIDKFEEHEGPVRGIAFHNTQPLFVSGGDDYKIKLWNWKLRRCNFTLNGHLDYVRTVFFHHEAPWIISASDDQTIRIWNWQNRNCLSILTGHNHYVMCAMFHPKDDLIVSASLDQSVRVWDISGLRKKHSTAPQQPTFEDIQRVAAAAATSGQQPDLFGSTDAIVKYVLEGHDRGVNWAAFHPTLPLIVSGADDRQVKLWRMNETKAWEVDTCRGHYNNVSCVLFHPRAELIISDSEDRTIRVWDMTKRTALQTFRREHDRFWIMGAHPELNLFAAGHDSGLIVFKLERERPPHAVFQNNLFYLRDKTIRVYDFTSGSDVGLVSIKKQSGNLASGVGYRGLSYNPAEHSVLLTLTGEIGSYELYSLPKDKPSEPREPSDVKRGNGANTVFIARNRFAVFDKANQQIIVKDLSNESTKTIKTPATVVDLFYAGTKNLLLTTATSVLLFDTEVRQTVAELSISGVRQVVWSPDNNLVALVSKHSVAIANKQLEQLSLIHETMKIKGGAWDEIGIFIFSTLNHIKYVLPTGDKGIIKTLEQPVYITKVKGKSVFTLNREVKVRTIAIDPTEYRFKLALCNKNYDEVLHIIRTSNLVGQSIIAYLQKKGYPEVALHFVKEPKTRFELALECGNVAVAVETARTLDNDDAWAKLAAEALKSGNHQVVEAAYQRIKNFDRLSFLYLITGNVDKLRKMLKINESRKAAGVMSRYHNALYLGDVEDQIKMLREVGQYQLAYLTAKTHGLEEEAASILETAGIETAPELTSIGNARLLKPPAPIIRQCDTNWPLLTITRGFFEGGFVQTDTTTTATKPLAVSAALALEDSTQEAVGDWGGDDDDLDLDDEPSYKPKATQPSFVTSATVEPEGDGGWEDDLDLGIEDLPLDLPAQQANVAADIKLPNQGPSPQDAYLRSQLAVYHVTAGSFESAMQLLNRQIAAVNFVPFQSLFLQIYAASRTWMPASADTPPISFAVFTGEEKKVPVPVVTVSSAIETLQNAYAAVKSGGFSSAITLFRQILREVVLIVVEKRSDVEEVNQLISVCREYILGSRLGLLALETRESDPKRSLEVAAYFTHCQLQPPHLQRSLHSAMLKAVKMKNMATGLNLAKRLLELGPPADMGQQ
ncbi:hypothetical protein HK096_009300, partial [Nowakowskiella sp. JEL0078]